MTVVQRVEPLVELGDLGGVRRAQVRDVAERGDLQTCAQLALESMRSGSAMKALVRFNDEMHAAL